MFLKPFFHQRNKQRTCLFDHFNIRSHALDDFRVHSALYSRIRSYNSDFLIPGCLYSRSCARDHNTHDRDIKFISHGIQRQSARRITGNNDRFYLLCFQKAYNLL